MHTQTLLSIHDVERILRLTPRQISGLVKRGEIPHVVLPGDEVRFDPDDLRAWIEAHKAGCPEVGDDA